MVARQALRGAKFFYFSVYIFILFTIVGIIMAKEAMDDWTFDKLLGSINMVGSLNYFPFFIRSRSRLRLKKQIPSTEVKLSD